MLQAMCLLAGLFAVLAVVGIVYQVASGAAPAISRFGIGFVWHTEWEVPFNKFGAASALYGTFVCSAMALVIAMPLGIAIAVYLSMIAPRSVRQVVGPLVEMLAAVPSIVLGLFGVVILAPYIQRHVEPPLHSVLGFLPIFGTPQATGLSLFTAGLLLSFMVLPIIASLSRDLFLTVPRELKEGAEALGATRWEVIRGVVLPTTISGVIGATVLALGRALGEAIAVYSVIGFGQGIHGSLFSTGVTLAARIANDIQDYSSGTQLAALFYLALLLLVIGVITSIVAQAIARRFEIGLGVTTGGQA
jgi:phosphate transport system permease protein